MDLFERFQQKLAEKKKKTTPAEATATIAGTAFGAKALERSGIEWANKGKDFRSFDEVMKHYSDMKSGDVLMFKETFTGGKTHPIIVIDPKTNFYWPSGDAYKSGLRTPLAVPNTPEHQELARQAKTNPDIGKSHIERILKEQKSTQTSASYWHTPYKGKFFEVLSRKGDPVEIGSLEGKLWDMSSVQKKVKTAPDKFHWEREFSSQASRRLGGVYRSPNVNPKKLKKVVEKLKIKSDKGNVRYSIKPQKFDLHGACTTGTCITAADEVLRASGAKRPTRSYFPNQFARSLEEVVPSATKGTGRVNILTPMLVAGGALNIAKAQSNKTESKDKAIKRTLVGAGAIGAGVALNLSDPIKDSLSSTGGILARSLGGMILETPSKIVDKIKARRGGTAQEWQTANYATRQWLDRYPKLSGRVGAAVLGIPAAYGLYKGLERLSQPSKTKTGAEKKEKSYTGTNVLTVGSAGALGLGLTRAYHQKKLDPNVIDVVGGTNVPAPNVFNAQRESWARELSNAGAKVREVGSYNADQNYQHGRYTLNTTIPAPSNAKAELHVGRPGQTVFTTLYNRIVRGQPQYRVFSDFGPGSQDQPRKFLGGTNAMKAPRSPIYTRNIVPGGDVIGGTIRSIKPNINVETIPTKTEFADLAEKIPAPDMKGKRKIYVSAGTGFTWPNQFPLGKGHLETMMSSLDEVYGKGKYEVTLLGGPNARHDYVSYFRSIAEKNPDSFKYVEKTDRAGVAKLYRESHISMMAPGSTSAELASMKGYKPKIISVIPKTDITGHFVKNTEWLEKRLGGTVRFDTPDTPTKEMYTNIFKKIESMPHPTEEAIKITTTDTSKVLSAIEKDFESSKRFTRRLRTVGTVGLGLAAGISLYKELGKKSEK